MLKGNSGNDSIFGDAGDDFIYGGSGTDSIMGGEGNDTINTGSGCDNIYFSEEFGHDIITDFKPGQDQIYIASNYLGNPQGRIDMINNVGDGNSKLIEGKDSSITFIGISREDFMNNDFVIWDGTI